MSNHCCDNRCATPFPFAILVDLDRNKREEAQRRCTAVWQRDSRRYVHNCLGVAVYVGDAQDVSTAKCITDQSQELVVAPKAARVPHSLGIHLRLDPEISPSKSVLKGLRITTQFVDRSSTLL